MIDMVNSMLTWLRNLYVCKRDEYIYGDEGTPSLDKLVASLEELKGIADSIQKELHEERVFCDTKIKRQEAIFKAMMDVLPDMVWMKDLDGAYMYTNKAIEDGLLFDRNPIGKIDIDIARAAKDRFGVNNRTFGEVCGDSDKVVIEKAINGTFSKEDGRFLEDGKVKGRMMYLEVFKAPVYFDGELIGVCGGGRDMTEYIESYRYHECGGCSKAKDIFSKYEYRNTEE